jgi:TolA-binding protein
MKKTILMLPVLPFLLTNCASLRGTSSAKISKTPRVIELERKMKEREQARQDLRDRQRLLSEKKHLTKTAPSATSLRVSAHPQQRQKNVVVEAATGLKTDLKISDRELYGELLAAYDRNDEFGFHSRLQMFQERFARSPLMEDSLYLAGMMAVSEKNYGVALRNFNRILKEHPHGHKVASALFAKGATLKKMNLPDQARQSWLQVQKHFPGSPESMRAAMEIKILNR